MQIENHEQRALKLINGLNTHNCHRLIGHGFGPDKATEIGWIISDYRTDLIPEPFTSFEALADIDLTEDEIDKLFHWSHGVIAREHEEMLRRLQTRHTAKTLNRTRYLPEAVLQYRRFTRRRDDGQGNEWLEDAEGWRYDTMLRSAGLLNLVIETMHGNQPQPVAVQLVNMLPKETDPRTGRERDRPDIPADQWQNANNNSIAVSGERLGWNMNSLGWHILRTAFPNAVWLSAYGHSLNSPVLPEGYWPKVPVTLRQLVDPQGRELGTDGSGLWNVDHPMFEAFISKHGICAWQVRGLHPRHGVFVKGAVRPVSLGPDEPAFILDWNQVKGLKKEAAMRHRGNGTEFTQTGMHVGCMQVWNRPRATLQSCFEMLENIQVNKETVAIIKELVDEAIDKLRDNGTDRIVAQICQDDERLAQVVQLVNMLKERGAEVEPTQIPMVRSAVKGKLEKILWRIVQGAGISYKQRLCILDNTVKPGTIVATGVKPGTVITTFRFPMVLAQGLRTLVATMPEPHMLCHGEQVQCVVFMNPADLTTCMQGDDDGDIVGISTDPRMVELFKHLVDDNIYHIEPEGKKIWHDVGSHDGLEYLRWDQRGPVGLATNYRSSLLAVGDVAGANAISIIIQESVDAPKRQPDWSDFRAAAVLSNWTEDENGELHFNIRLKPEELEEGGLPVGMMRDWVHSRLIERGCAKTSYGPEGPETVPDQACAWRWPGRRVDLDEWVPTSHRTGWKGGNLVHICHDYAFEQFAPVRPSFALSGPEINLTMLLPVMLAQRGVITHLIGDGDWNIYDTGLRRKSGLWAFGQKVGEIYGKKYDHDEHLRAIDEAIAKLNQDFEQADLNIDEIVTIWMMETQRLDPETGGIAKAGINNAFRVLSIPNNPVMLALGITKSASCKWMLQQVKTKSGPMRRLDLAVKVSMSKPNPQEHLAEAIYSDTQHGNDCSDEDGAKVHLWECPMCKQLVTDALVQKIRANRQSSESLWLRQAISSMNQS